MAQMVLAAPCYFDLVVRPLLAAEGYPGALGLRVPGKLVFTDGFAAQGVVVSQAGTDEFDETGAFLGRVHRAGKISLRDYTRLPSVPDTYTDAEKLAVAVLKGDTQAALLLADEVLQTFHAAK